MAALRRFAWWSFLVTEVGLVAAATAYVGIGTREFWLVAAAAGVAVVAYAVAVRLSPMPMPGDASRSRERWYWS
jgi:hypothetical protein